MLRARYSRRRWAAAGGVGAGHGLQGIVRAVLLVGGGRVVEEVAVCLIVRAARASLRICVRVGVRPDGPMIGRPRKHKHPIKLGERSQPYPSQTMRPETVTPRTPTSGYKDGQLKLEESRVQKSHVAEISTGVGSTRKGCTYVETGL